MSRPSDSFTCAIKRRTYLEAVTGFSRSTIYLRITQGLLPTPVALGARAVGWPQAEIEAINRARIAGQDDAALRVLVLELAAQRTAGGAR